MFASRFPALCRSLPLAAAALLMTAPGALAWCPTYASPPSPNQPPVAVLSASASSVLVNELPGAAPSPGDAKLHTVRFDAGKSFDPEDDGCMDVDWDLDGDGEFEINNGDAKQEMAYFKAGSVTVSARVSDKWGALDTATRTVVVTRPAAKVDDPPAPEPAKPDPSGPVPTGAEPQMPAGSGPPAEPTAPTVPQLPTGDVPGAPTAPSGLPVDATAPAGSPVALASTKLKLGRGGKVRIKLQCPAGTAGCDGTIRLRTKGKRPQSAGSLKFAIEPGQTRNFGLLLPAVHRLTVRRTGKLALTATIRTPDRTTTQGILIGL